MPRRHLSISYMKSRPIRDGPTARVRRAPAAPLRLAAAAGRWRPRSRFAPVSPLLSPPSHPPGSRAAPAATTGRGGRAIERRPTDGRGVCDRWAPLCRLPFAAPSLPRPPPSPPTFVLPHAAHVVGPGRRPRAPRSPWALPPSFPSSACGGTWLLRGATAHAPLPPPRHPPPAFPLRWAWPPWTAGRRPGGCRMA